MGSNPNWNRPAPREGYIPVDNAGLYYRVVGQGQPVIVLHGGPDFDHSYFLPDLDRLSDSYQLIYYDQRGRGKSADNVQPEDVTIQSEIDDLERLREYFGLDKVALLGHSWGGLLAMEYAIRHPDRVSHLILVNTAPASRDDYLLFRQERRKRTPDNVEKLQAMSATTGYREGDPDTVAAYYRIHFKGAIRQPEHLEQVVGTLRASFTKDGILKAWEIEQRLMGETWLSSEYDLLPDLRQLNMPALIIHGEDDFIPVECANHIVDAIPGARFALLRECGHYSYIESPDEVRKEIADFFHGS
ncbi:MAG: alpha/beta fold hydrolase [Chloroflexota bacterium]